ncbi:hypothetical protein GWI33_015113 [Rhynchophorus ferrugineus]|uniref:Uncharacterized protein n=1 Tax=Rhynchophorus ferrugineus TaxID=354439 RepID=A0A834I357_RHYFE|nr:hypothetical protein GWI33_015113 [Rhynchophorus ferrugineus]
MCFGPVSWMLESQEPLGNCYEKCRMKNVIPLIGSPDRNDVHLYPGGARPTAFFPTLRSAVAGVSDAPRPRAPLHPADFLSPPPAPPPSPPPSPIDHGVGECARGARKEV